MAKKGKPRRFDPMRGKKKATAATARKAPKQRARNRPASRGNRAKRPEERTFPEMGDLKDRQLMKVAKLYADEMHVQSESAAAAEGHKQLARKRMEQLGIKVFTGHGIEFTLVPGEEKFKARQIKKGDTTNTSADEPEPGPPAHDFDTDASGRPTDSPAGDDDDPAEE